MATDSSNPGNPSAPKPATLLHRGEHDSDVLKLQQQLHRLGYPVAADGVFGPQTEAALRDAQAHAGVTPNGIAGPQSTLALANLEANGYHADPHAMHAPHAPHLPDHGHHAPLAPEHLPAQEMAHLGPDHQDHHGHHEPVVDLGTLPFPDAHHESPDHLADDPYKPEEHHDLHGHEDPYKPEEDHASALHPELGHDDPYALHDEPDHDEPKDDDAY